MLIDAIFYFSKILYTLFIRTQKINRKSLIPSIVQIVQCTNENIHWVLFVVQIKN